MLDMNRNRQARAEGVQFAASNTGTQETSDQSLNQLAIVPHGALASPPPKRDPKRTRMNTDGKEGNSVAAKASLAGSQEGCRRAQ